MSQLMVFFLSSISEVKQRKYFSEVHYNNESDKKIYSLQKITSMTTTTIIITILIFFSCTTVLSSITTGVVETETTTITNQKDSGGYFWNFAKYSSLHHSYSNE